MGKNSFRRKNGSDGFAKLLDLLDTVIKLIALWPYTWMREGSEGATEKATLRKLSIRKSQNRGYYDSAIGWQGVIAAVFVWPRWLLRLHADERTTLRVLLLQITVA
ncbi:hypothetical protein ACFQ3J_23655 [Paenibacillus provencensis]|uniref:Uncharacterized protein n=1 Tax=Paenibacillus provencensis TaxID=441151 RepID=A0ABW3PYI9_9BACL|nr:hypothetical protein [Paenibacillus sp. MER 78]MCM3130074.1 hypothetical protein [Paenibacillus sp. MER 78]